MNGKIIKISSNLFTVETEKEIIDCSIKGKFRYEKIKPVVGDNVLVDPDLKQIIEIKKRTNELIRPLVSNINKLFIVVSTKIPAFSTYLLDKFLLLSLSNNITPVIIITKMDLLNSKDKKEIKSYIKYYKKLGFTIYENKDLRKIKKEIKNNTISLMGQTGAGKSSLLNKLDKNLNLKTDEVSTHLGRGKHTTRTVELFHSCNGLIADTPGFSSLELYDIKKEQVILAFPEFNKVCKYKSCTHTIEEGCNVLPIINKNKIIKERHENYKKLLKEVENKK